MSLPGLYVSEKYDTHLPRATHNIDIYWYDIAIGTLIKCYMTAGWSEWKWCSGSGIGDRMNVPDNNNELQIKNKAVEELGKQIL